MRNALLALAILLTAGGGCGGSGTKEDTSDETTVQFHEHGQLRYGRWYEFPSGNRACRWYVETKPAGDDAKPTLLESGSYDDALRVRAETPGRDVFLRFNKACGLFRER